jgi:hypothetical protein
MVFPVQKDRVWPATLLLAVELILTSVLASAKIQSFTGKISDAMCGVKHTMPGDEGNCVRTCVNMGSKYALVVDDKTFTLDTTDKTVLSELERLSGHSATVTGEADGDTITVSSVTPAK